MASVSDGMSETTTKRYQVVAPAVLLHCAHANPITGGRGVVHKYRYAPVPDDADPPDVQRLLEKGLIVEATFDG